MSSLVKSISFALFIMFLIFLAMLVMPDVSTLGWKTDPPPPPPLVSSPADCNKLAGSEVYECIIKFALEGKNDALCENIDNDFYKDKCYTEVTGDTNPTVCDKLITPEKRGMCFVKQALALGDPGACASAASSKISGSEAVDICFFEYAKGTGSRQVCERILGTNKAGECLYGFALNSRNPEDCASNSKDASDYCLIRLAIDTKNGFLCASLEGEIKDQCYVQIASLTKDPSLCNFLMNRELFDGCLKQAK